MSESASLCVPKTDVLGFIDVLIRFWGQRSKIRVTAGGDITVDGSPCSSIYSFVFL